MISNLDLSSVEAIKHKFYLLDIMKFVCAFLVVAIHLSPLSDISNCGNYILVECIARIAVPFYFVSSGFLLFRKVSFECYNIKILFDYAKKILKLYGIWMLIYAPVIIESLMQNGGIVHNILFIGKMYLMWGYHHLWYLHATFIAILIIIFLIKKKFSINSILIISIALYAIGLLAQSWFGLIKPFQEVPYIWKLLKAIENIIRTTKNGFTFGFLFVSIGFWFSKNKVGMKFRDAVLGLCISMSLLLLESLFVEYYSLARNHDMYISLIPTTFFLFYIVTHIELKERRIYEHLRKVGFLVYLIHIWVDKIVLTWLGEQIHSLLRYCLVLLISILLAEIVICLREKKRYKVFEYLY